MAASLRTAEPDCQPGDWTRERLRALPADGPRYEIIDGVLSMISSPTNAHQLVLAALGWELQTFLKRTGIATVLLAPVDLPCSETTVLQPDLLVCPGPLPMRFEPTDARRVMLVVELLSPATQHRDRGVMRERYLRAGVAEYWLVDIEARELERWSLGWPQPTVVRDDVIWWPPGATEPFRLALPTFFSDALQPLVPASLPEMEPEPALPPSRSAPLPPAVPAAS